MSMEEWLPSPHTPKTSVEHLRSSLDFAVGKNAESVRDLSRGPSRVRYSKRDFTPLTSAI